MSRPPHESVETVAIIGGGTIGTSWAAYFLGQRIGVHLVEPHRNSREIKTDIDSMQASRAGPNAAAPLSAESIRVTQRIDDSLAHAGFVQECGPERVAVKKAILSQLEEVIAPDTVIASSTSALLPTALQQGMDNPERLIVGHPFNPPHLIPLVEVVAGQLTSAQAVNWAMDFYAHVGKFPVRVKKEAVGHVANRLTAALFREALYMVETGIADVADIDAVMTQGPGLRWAIMGPFLTYHLAGGSGGIAHYMEHLGPTQSARWRTLGNPELSPALVERVVAQVTEMAGEQMPAALVQKRDEQLLALLALVAQRKGTVNE